MAEIGEVGLNLRQQVSNHRVDRLRRLEAGEMADAGERVRQRGAGSNQALWGGQFIVRHREAVQQERAAGPVT